jgi:hypothetical protein
MSQPDALHSGTAHSVTAVIADDDVIEPLTPRQRWLVVALALGVAATRFLALSRSMWDWDEALFASALQHYDVAQHHPHPPGFPLFFAMAKLARFVVQDDFHALRAVSLVASFFVFPAIFALARSFRFRFRTCVAASLLFCFLPNVWYWGGTAFTDELALVTALAAAALLLRSGRRSYIGGCLLFAATMLVRAQNVLLLWPWIVASWRRLRARRIGELVTGTALAVTLVVTGYGIAAKVTGFPEFISATKGHEHYIATVDGALNPRRIPMGNLLQDFLFDPFESRAASTAMFVFALLSFARPRRAHIDLLLTFLPNFFLTWFLLSPTGISRLSLSYIAFDVLLAADGLDVAATFIASRFNVISRERLAAPVQAALAALIIGRYVVWVWPGLHEVRASDSPPVQAMVWIRKNVPRGRTIYLNGGMEAFGAYFLPDYKIVASQREVRPKSLAENDAYLATDHLDAVRNAVNFQRPHKPLWTLFNRRYFEASVVPVTSMTAVDRGASTPVPAQSSGLTR